MTELSEPAEPAEPAEPSGQDGPEQLDLPGALRGLRRRADVSQRELAARGGVPASTVARIESGAAPDPRVRTMERLVHAVGARLAIVDLDGTEPAGLAADRWRDRADRRYPAHLDPGPENRWRRGAAEDVITFFRNRWLRDAARRDRSGERSWHVFTEVRRLRPGDTALLAAAVRAEPELGFSGRPELVRKPPRDRAALRYLRDPSVRHWVAEAGGTVYGQLVAYLHRRPAGPATIVVTEFGLRPEHRTGPLGPMLLAALCAEADRCRAGAVVGLIRDAGAARYLRGLGFARWPRSRRPVLLEVPG